MMVGPLSVETATRALAIEKSVDVDSGDGSPLYSLRFGPADVEPLARAIRKAGLPANGHTIQSAMVRLSEVGDPEWGEELDFDSESDMFCVRSERKAPLVHLRRRLEKRLVDPVALRRLVKAIPND